MQARRTVAAVAAGAGMLATFLPWIDTPFLSLAGTSGDGGWITFGLFALALTVALLGERALKMYTAQRFLLVLVGIAAGTVALYCFSKIREAPLPAMGPGVYLAIIAAIVVVGVASLGEDVFPGTIAVGMACMIGFAGAVHITTTRGDHTKLCEKARWSLRHTFIDLADYDGKQVSDDNREVVGALVECGLLTETHDDNGSVPPPPPAPPPPDPSIGSRCVVENAETVGNTVTGICRDLSDCTTPAVYYRGACPGPASEVCCVTER